MKKKICVFFLFLIAGITFAQNNFRSNYLTNPEKDQNINNKFFTKINDSFNKNLNTNFNYPLNEGDFWEYIIVDTTSFMDVYHGLKHSEIKEVIGDTLMPNGLTYKIIKWENCANSIYKLPEYEFQRKDSSNKIYIFYNNKDNLLFDLSLNVGAIYHSHYSDYNWKIERKYTVIGFEDTLSAIDLGKKSNLVEIRDSNFN